MKTLGKEVDECPLKPRVYLMKLSPSPQGYYAFSSNLMTEGMGTTVIISQALYSSHARLGLLLRSLTLPSPL